MWSKVQPWPAGKPDLPRGMPVLPWDALNRSLPEMHVPDAAGRTVGGGEKVSHFGGRKGATSVVTQWTLGERLGTELNYDLHRKPILVSGNSTSCPAATVLSTVPPWRSHRSG